MHSKEELLVQVSWYRMSRQLPWLPLSRVMLMLGSMVRGTTQNSVCTLMETRERLEVTQDGEGICRQWEVYSIQRLTSKWPVGSQEDGMCHHA